MFLQNISKFISNYRYEQSTVASMTAVKAAFLDFFGVTYRGIEEEASNIALTTIDELFSGKIDLNFSASVIGKNLKTDVLSAAFINGVAAHVLELDDGHRGAQLHLGSVIFPTALAISEAHDLTGREFLESVIVGYEVGILLGKLVNPDHRDNGFHTTGTIGTFVAGAVAAKLLKLDVDQILNTLGLCGTQAAGLLESDHGGSMGKVLHVGKAAYNGILSAYLARNGFTGSGTIFDGDEGFLRTMVLDKQEEFSLEDALRNVGNVSVRDIYFKKYPFCRHLHSSIDTALKLKASIGDEYSHIQHILVETYEVAAQHDNYHPKNIEELKQSLPYAIAISLVVGEVSVDKINQLVEFGLLENYSTVDDVNAIKKIVNNMTIISDDELTKLYPSKRPSNIIIRLDEVFRNGTFQNSTLLPKGDFENPFQLKELIEKFKGLNPKYDVSNLTVIDSIEEYNMKYVVGKLNGR
ncbi:MULTISPECIES: MmgE/PrpD family protein [Methanobrevibacter]|uniref:MmgE/PrpD family protein n=1 Tax=Methanobrevibacter TaxID=2172 RepID=UPI0015BB6E47|nr:MULTISPECIES: MmgE/PrpD family protein [Methanobrevibacter]MBS7256964.1 MmgE/PrpD family protein [Methanobrevibacter sp.]MCI7427919.1 MmgE/PrpD family protein [Methanobrevibacter sp.]MDD6775773.1 MmgE/PrpD family protein [Methanobacteriaceae archaeon]MDY3097426.1 MmgE/PrpD family protein [Methanobrevibacter sp.]